MQRRQGKNILRFQRGAEGRQRRHRLVGMDETFDHGEIDAITLPCPIQHRIPAFALQGREVGRLSGPAEISTAKGDIRIAEAVRGTVVLATQAGDIAVTAAAGVSATLDAGTAYGRVSNTLKNDGTAGLDIRATTSKGDITARSL